MEYGRFSKLLPGWLKYKILSPAKNTDSEATPPLVRLQTFLFLCLAPLLIACAYQGTIVEKAGRPLPFAYSLGIDASYKFALRDRLGYIRWQLVSAEVFNSYRVGDYFDDESPTPPRHRPCLTDGKEVLCPPVHETISISVPRFQPIPLEPRAVQR
jgi:hypothetical protein